MAAQNSIEIRLILACGTLTACMALSVWGQAAPAGGSDVKSKEWASQLSDKDPAVRDAARGKLNDQLAQAQQAADGAAKALENAKAAPPTDDPAKKDDLKKQLADLSQKASAATVQAARVRMAIDMALNQVDKSNIGKATNVMLDLSDATVNLAVEQLAMQTGFDIRMLSDNQGNQPLNPVTIEVFDAPFWAVCRDVCQQSGLSIVNQGGDNRSIRLASRNRGGQDLFNSPLSINGAFLVSAQQVNRQNNANLSAGGKIDRNLSIQCMILAEPKLRITRYYTEPVLDEAVDDLGNSLKPDSRNGGGGYGSSQGYMWNVSLPLKYPEKPGSKIAKLRGAFRARVLTEMQSIEIDKITEVKDFVVTSSNGMKLTVKSFTKNGDRYQIQTTIGRGALDRQTFNDAMNTPSFRLLDAKGIAFRTGGQGGGGGDSERNYNLHFYRSNGDDGEEALGEPAKLVWDAPIATDDVTIPFEFVDLPLP